MRSQVLMQTRSPWCRHWVHSTASPSQSMRRSDGSQDLRFTVYSSAPFAMKNTFLASSPAVKTISPSAKACGWMHPLQSLCMTTFISVSRYCQNGWPKSAGACIWNMSSLCNDSESPCSMVRLLTCTSLLCFCDWCSRYLKMRSERSLEMLRCLRYRRSNQNCFKSSLLRFLRLVIMPVMLPTMEEKATMAKKSTTMEKVRSATLRALTSIEAGVNWVRLQCKAVVYLYGSSASSTLPTSIQFLTPASMQSLPMRYHAQAITWFSTNTETSSLPKLTQMKVCSVSIKSYSR
mmetsp:Transcript_81587/g.231009  ORF Transcript_81587/g.231009 Transcript_81587/m.231009 type:complete len:291 (-) Transcript_81587:999-1871(-)